MLLLHVDQVLPTFLPLPASGVSQITLTPYGLAVNEADRKKLSTKVRKRK